MLGSLFAFLYFTGKRRFLGLRLRTWLFWLPLLLIFTAWLNRWGQGWIIFGAILEVGLWLLYGWGRRNGFMRFIPEPALTAPKEASPLKDQQRMEVRATGRFSVRDMEAYMLEQPAEYWRAPIGDHGFMVQFQPGRFLYQFIHQGNLLKVEAGQLVFGRQLRRSLAITFHSEWGPENFQSSISFYLQNSSQNNQKLMRQIYLTFDDEAEMHTVWQNLLRDQNPAP